MLLLWSNYHILFHCRHACAFFLIDIVAVLPGSHIWYKGGWLGRSLISEIYEQIGSDSRGVWCGTEEYKWTFAIRLLAAIIDINFMGKS